MPARELVHMTVGGYREQHDMDARTPSQPRVSVEAAPRASSVSGVRRILQRLSSWFGRPRAPLGLIACAAILLAPALATGLVTDDHVHALILRGSQEIPEFVRGPLDLFSFVTPDVTEGMIARGVLPWYADPEARYAFFRPLTSATHWLDYALWPGSPMMMHAHNIAWALLCALAAGALYRELLKPRWVAVLAFALYALDDARAPIVGWIANRNAVLAGALSIFSVVLFIRAQRDGSRIARWASPLLFGAGLLSLEGAVAAAGYLLAAAWFLGPGPRPRRLLALAPHVLIAVAWLAASRWLGYGVERSGEYFDPMRNTGEYLRHVPERALTLLFSQLTGSFAEWWDGYKLIIPAFAGIFLAIALVACLVFVWLALPLLRRSPSARFFFTGALLSLFPAVTAYPADRMLTWVALGVFGVLAEFLGSVIEGTERRRVSWIVAPIIAVHLVLAPLLMPLRAIGMESARDMLDRVDATIPRSDEIVGRTLIYLNAPTDAFFVFVLPTRAALGIPRPERQHSLATGVSPMTVRRLDERTLSVEPRDGYLTTEAERLFRSPFSMKQGERVRLPNLTAEVVELKPDGRPARVNFYFDRPLEDREYAWYRMGERGYVPFVPPRVGEVLTVPETDLGKLAFGDDHPLVRFIAALRQVFGKA